MTDTEWNSLLNILRVVGPVAGTTVGGWIIYLLRQILETMRDFNDRIITLERDHAAHRALDDERFSGLQRQLDDVRWNRHPNGMGN